MRVEALYRYPVKGLTAESLDAADLPRGGTIPWDRAFALAQGDAPFDPAGPRHLPKHNFLCLMKNERAALLACAFDPATSIMSIAAPNRPTCRENALTDAGRIAIADFLTGYLGEEARGRPLFHHVPGHVFSDVKDPLVSLINLETLAAFEARVGQPRHRMRFRANLYISGLDPWSEFDLVGRDLRVGTAVLRIKRRTPRCPATQVNPATGERDADPMTELRSLYGHLDLGVYAEIVESGTARRGDAMVLI